MHRLNSILDKLEDCVSSALTKGTDNIDSREMAMCTDMIKDITEAMYYYSIFEAMRDESGNENERYGYNRPYGAKRRYPQYEQFGNEYDSMNYRMGYSDGSSGGSSRNSNSGNSSNTSSSNNNSSGGSGNHRYGMSYGNYERNRRHYHDTNDVNSKSQMHESMSEVFNDMENMVSNIITDMTPEEKNKYRQKLNAMMNKIQ